MEKNLNERFHESMLDIYKRAKKEAGYNATRYLQLLDQHKGLKTAKILIDAPKVSDGYTALWERQRLDLTVEALIFDNPEYHELFTDKELCTVKQRLVQYQYGPALEKK